MWLVNGYAEVSKDNKFPSTKLKRLYTDAINLRAYSQSIMIPSRIVVMRFVCFLNKYSKLEGVCLLTCDAV